MSNELGIHFHLQRIRLGMSLGQLAKSVGYKNISKGANRISRFERTGEVRRDLLEALAEALHIDLPIIEVKLRRWEAWVNQPAPMQMIFRLKLTVFLSKPLPPEINSHEQAEAFACDFARQHRVRLCLVLCRRRSIWISRDGEVEIRIEATPYEPELPLQRLIGNIATFLVE